MNIDKNTYVMYCHCYKHFFFNWEVRYTERKRDKEEDLLFIDSLPKWLQRLKLSQSEARSLESLSCLPRRCRVPKLWAVLNCFPRPQAGSWMERGAARIRTGAHMGFWHMQGEDF